MNELPVGWAWTTLGEIGDYLNGRGFKKSEWRERGRPIIRIQNLTGSGAHFNHFDGEPDERYVARDGDLLVSWAATLGVFVWRGPEAVVNQHIFKVVSHVDRRFHRYLLQSTLDELQRKTHGSGMVHITRSKFDSTLVAIPPLVEQRRIVAVIEEHLSRLDVADGTLEGTAARRVVGLRRATLAAAVMGPWPRIAIGDLATDTLIGLDRSRSRQSQDPQAGSPYVRMGNISADGQVTWEDLTFVPVTRAEQERFALRDGDLLFNTRNSRALVGKVGLVRNRPDLAVFNNNLMRIRMRDDVDPAYAWVAMNSPSFRSALDSVKNATTNVAAIYAKNLLPLEVPVPPLDQQRRIVAAVAERLSTIDALRASIERAKKRSAALRRAILERAFRGDLVPQDPADEPASVLLERIRAERAAKVIVKSRRGSRSAARRPVR